MDQSITTALLDAMEEARKKTKMDDKGDYALCFNLGASTYESFMEASLIRRGLLQIGDADSDK